MRKFLTLTAAVILVSTPAFAQNAESGYIQTASLDRNIGGYGIVSPNLKRYEPFRKVLTQVKYQNQQTMVLFIEPVIPSWNDDELSDLVRSTMNESTDWQGKLARERTERNWHQYHDAQRFRRSVMYSRQENILAPGFVLIYGTFGQTGD